MATVVNYFSNEYDNAIAIIGISGEFPESPSPEALWENILNEKECIHFFSNEELLNAGIDKETLDNPNYIKASPILSDIYRFDADFFGYSPRESIAIDPQQRLFLQHAWHTLEDAGYSPAHTPGTVGVFAGSGGILNSYLLAYFQAHPEIQGLNSTFHHFGNDKDFMPARTSYLFNLKGPSIAVQTACSSSTVAIHLACQSLLNGECDMALAGAVNIRVPHHKGYYYQEGGLYSKDGHCRIFDEEPGILYGSAVGIVLLKPLQKALQENDHIYGIIRSSAINNDGGEKISFAAASMKGQRNCLIEAIEVSEIPPESIQYVEVFGTGTKMGDQTEFNALSQAFRFFTNKTNFCALGSIKPNVGHLEVVSGISSLISLLFAMKNKTIPATINVNRLTSDVDFSQSPFYLNTEKKAWDVNETPRRAALNSIAIGGTNAVLIVEEFQEESLESSDENLIQDSPFLLVLSAKTVTALSDLINAYDNFLDKNPNVSLKDLCFTANNGREHFLCRTFAVIESIEELKNALKKGDLKNRITIAPSYQNTPSQISASPNPDKAYLNELGMQYLQGFSLAWNLLAQNKSGKRISLPTYPFQGEAYCIENHVKKQVSSPLQIEAPRFDTSQVSEKEIRNWLEKNLGTLLGYKEFNESDYNKPFSSLGLDSLLALDFHQKIRDKLPADFSISSSDFNKYNTLDTLAEFIYSHSKNTITTATRPLFEKLKTALFGEPGFHSLDNRLNSAKFFAIFLVVWYHFLRPIWVDAFMTDSHFMNMLNQFSCFFAMPVFIMISGYYAKKSLTFSDYQNILTKLLVPYFILNIVGYFLAPVHDKAILFIIPTVETWFLLDLAFWMIFLPLIYDIRWIVPISIFVSLLVGLTDSIGEVLGLSRFFYYLPFFLFGFLYGNRVFDYTFPFQKTLCLFTIFLVFVGFYFATPYLPEFIYYGKYAYSHLGLSQSMGMLIRALHISALFLTSIAFIWLIPRSNSLFSIHGQRTLYVYMTHLFFMEALILTGFYLVPHHWTMEFIMVPALFLLTLFLSTHFWYKLVRPVLQPHIEKYLFRSQDSP